MLSAICVGAIFPMTPEHQAISMMGMTNRLFGSASAIKSMPNGLFPTASAAPRNSLKGLNAGLAHLIQPSHNARFSAILDQHLPRWKHIRDDSTPRQKGMSWGGLTTSSSPSAAGWLG
jgi:hypothetical protein